VCTPGACSTDVSRKGAAGAALFGCEVRACALRCALLGRLPVCAVGSGHVWGPCSELRVLYNMHMHPCQKSVSLRGTLAAGSICGVRAVYDTCLPVRCVVCWFIACCPGVSSVLFHVQEAYYTVLDMCIHKGA
jgi:hypothetical protein